MKNHVYKRVGAVVLTAALTLQGLGTPTTVFAQESMHKVRSQSQTQMSSAPELVYVNTYNDTTVRTQNFDSNWKFYLGEAGDAQAAGFDDSKWRQISLPHDYSIEQEFSDKMEAESGYLPGGTGWYRKNFILGEELSDKRIRIDFDGVYMNATVWVNGQKLGTHPYGYTPFSFDITDYVNFGEENTIAVKVEHKTPSSRWYSGSGIYRSVNLTVTDNVHVDLYGTKISTPDLKTEKGGDVTMNIATTVANDSAEAAEVTVTHTVFEKGDESAVIGSATSEAANVAAGTSAKIDATVKAANPTLWGVDTPQLYTVRTEVKMGDQVVDTYDTEYGFRYVAVDKNTGFYLNGEPLKLKGVCMHHDQGALGAVANRRAIERQVEILKNMGCNSIRVTHNPAAQALIDVCNEKGILVIDEFFDGWKYHKNGNNNDYATSFAAQIEADNQILGREDNMVWSEFDLKATIGRGENDPSIIMWSLGNEIDEGAGGTGYDETASDLINWAQETGTTKLLTIGSNRVKNGGHIGNPNSEHIRIGEMLTELGGVSGTNYSNGSSYDALHRTYPEWNLLGSETASSVNSRGIYTTKANQGLDANNQLTSYDKSCVSWGALASAAWYDVITRDFVMGEYVWTGFDYIGEPTPANNTNPGPARGWPSPKNSYFGIVDTAGFPKDSYYFYQSVWNDDVHTLHILPAWNENALMKDNSGNVEVVVYTDAAKVELFLNGEKVGEQTMETKTTPQGYTYQQVTGQSGHDKQYMTFSVPYKAGTLTAKAYDAAGKEITDAQGRSEVRTTGTSAKLSAEADRTEIAADGKDLTYITVDVTDKNGNIVPDAANRVKFNVEGEGILVGIDNGSSPDHDSYKGTSRKAFSGKVLAIVQSTKNAGEITVTATADGLEPAEVKINTTAVDDGTEKAQVDHFKMSKVYYVKTGNKAVLPETIETVYTDGTSKLLPVTWDRSTEAESGSFMIKGMVDGQYSVTVNVTMIDEVAALLNYSAATPVGIEPVLPETRQAVMKDGEIMSVAFEVRWDKPDAEVYNTATEDGKPIEISGWANVFGEMLEAKAFIRVQNETVTLGDSVSGAGYLSQDIPKEMQSDTLDAIKNGNTAVDANTGGGANPSIWSNYKNSQLTNCPAPDTGTADNKAEITFRYDTQQTLGKIVIHFVKDNWSMRFPKENTTEIYVSETGADDSWTKLEAKETIGTEKDRVKPYTYDFAPTGATFVKFCLTNSDEVTGNKKEEVAIQPSTGISEIELISANSAFVVNDDAALESLKVNGAELTAEELAAGSYATSAAFAEIEAVGAGNAAVTVLPVYENVVKIIVEAEDHSARSEFTVTLNASVDEGIDPADDSRDYPIANLQGKVIAGSELTPASGVEGPKEFVIDVNLRNHWHTNWNTNEATDVAKRWIGFNFQETVTIDGVRYQPRQEGNNNGTVSEYRIEIKTADNGEWTEVEGATGTWANADSNKDWRIVTFEPVEATQVRLVGVHTYADSGNDAHMSASGLRVTVPQEIKDINSEDITVTVENAAVDVVDEAHPAQVNPVVKDGDKTLVYGVDYLLEFADNTAEGTATVKIKGIGAYKGERTETYTIKKNARTLRAIWEETDECKTVYIEGDTFDPAGLKLNCFYSDGTSETVSYETAKDAFGFEPTLGTKLTPDMAKIKVTYEGKSAYVAITVNDKDVDSVDHISAKMDKTSYTEGDKLDVSGLEVTLHYTSGKAETLKYADIKDKITITPAPGTVLSAGAQVVTVAYEGMTAEISINVTKPEDPNAVDGMSVTGMKTSYKEGEKLDMSGMKLTITYRNGKTETLKYKDIKDELTITPANGTVLKAGDQVVTVTYKGYTVSFAIKVVEAGKPADPDNGSGDNGNNNNGGNGGNSGSTGNGGSSSGNTQGNGAKTGDPLSVLPFAALLFAGLGFAMLVLRRKTRA